MKNVHAPSPHRVDKVHLLTLRMSFIFLPIVSSPPTTPIPLLHYMGDDQAKVESQMLILVNSFSIYRQVILKQEGCWQFRWNFDAQKKTWHH